MSELDELKKLAGITEYQGYQPLPAIADNSVYDQETGGPPAHHGIGTTDGNKVNQTNCGTILRLH